MPADESTESEEEESFEESTAEDEEQDEEPDDRALSLAVVAAKGTWHRFTLLSEACCDQLPLHLLSSDVVCLGVPAALLSPVHARLRDAPCPAVQTVAADEGAHIFAAAFSEALRLAFSWLLCLQWW